MLDKKYFQKPLFKSAQTCYNKNMSGNELGLGSALSEKEGAVSPPSLFVLLLGHKKEHNLEGKNIYCAGCFGGSLGFDAANFGSCTVRGNLNCDTLNWWSLGIRRVSGPAGDYDGLVVLN